MLSKERFEQLYRASEKQLFNIAYRWAWNHAEAQELVHEAFIRVWSRRLLIDPDRAYAYLVRTVVNQCQKLARRRRRWQRVGETLGLAGERPPRPDQEYRQRQLRQAIETLPDTLRHVLLLTEFTDLKQAEIGDLLGIPSGTVGSRRNTAVRQLKEKFNEQ